ncbi:MAG: hypothetical protein WC136_05820 [Sphaerochaeta sp.]|nr:hypothetical protein [Sphaerochaeta sp.]
MKAFVRQVSSNHHTLERNRTMQAVSQRCTITSASALPSMLSLLVNNVILSNLILFALPITILLIVVSLIIL